MRRRMLLAAAGLFAVAVAVVIVVLLIRGSGGGQPKGALTADGGGTRVAGPAKGGRVYSDAEVELYNVGSKPIVLERVDALGARGTRVPPFRLTVAGAGRTSDIQGGLVEGYPPSFFRPSTIHPVRGFVVAPERTAQGRQGATLILSFRMPAAPSAFELAGLRIAYRQEGKSFTLDVDHALAFCAVARGRCRPDAMLGA